MSCLWITEVGKKIPIIEMNSNNTKFNKYFSSKVKNGKKMGMEKKERERKRKRNKEGRKEGGKGSRENSIDQGLEVNFHNCLYLIHDSQPKMKPITSLLEGGIILAWY